MSRIAILTPYAPPVPGGISTFVHGLAVTLRDRGNDVWIIAGEGTGDRDEHSDMGHGRTYVAQVLRRLGTLSPDLVHCHGHRTMLTAAVRYKRRNPGTQVVFSMHTTLNTPASSSLRRDLDDADVLTFVSAAQLAEMRARWRLAGDLRLLQPAILMRTPPSEASRQWAREHGVDGAFPTLMFAGPLEYEEKVAGVLDLVESMRTVREHHPGARLLVVGDGTLRSRVEDAASVFGDAVRVTGFVSDPSLALAAATIYCHISYQEGLPLAVLEAMSLGRCVLASRTGGIPEVIDGSNGRLVARGPARVARAILDLLASPDDMDRLATAARLTILEGYTWTARVTQLRSVYRGLTI